MPILNKRIRCSKEGLGDKRYGTVGGYRDGGAFVCSYAVAERLAARAGIDVEHAHRYLIALGVVAQEMLLAGEPVGLPHLGVLHIRERRMRVDPTALASHLREKGVKPRGKVKPYIARMRTVGFTQPLRLRRMFKESAIFTGPLADHVASKRRQLKKSLRRHDHGGLVHTKAG